MKARILNLDPYDDLETVKEKMGWGNNSHLILAWPTQASLLIRKLDFVLLQRHAKRLGAQLAFVTRDPDVIFHAKKLSIPVFRSLRRAQRSAWLIPSPPETHGLGDPNPARLEPLRRQLHRSYRVRPLDTPAFRIATFAIGVVAFLVLAAFVLPSAEIQLTPARETQTITLQVSASTDYNTFNLSGALPAHAMQVVVEGRDAIEVGGSIQIPENPATGEVVFTNLTSQAIALPTGTIVRTAGSDPVRFTTLEAGELAAQAGATASLPIQAINPGTGGNLPPNSLVALDSNLGLSVAVTNPEATSEGSERQSLAPSVQDYQRLRAQLVDTLAQNATERARIEMGENDMILSTPPEAVATLVETYSPSEISSASELSLYLQIEFSVLVVESDDLFGMAIAILDAGLAQGLLPHNETLTLQHLNQPTTDENGTAYWDVTIQREVSSEIPKHSVSSVVAGTPRDKAIQHLNNQWSLAAPATILTRPGWWPWLPFLPQRIAVNSK